MTRYDYATESDARNVAELLEIDGYVVKVCATERFAAWYVLTSAPCAVSWRNCPSSGVVGSVRFGARGLAGSAVAIPPRERRDQMLTSIEYTLPAYWASYLVNGDASGLEDGEQETIDAWLSSQGNIGQCVDVSEDTWFAWRNDSNNGLGGDVATFAFLVSSVLRSEGK